MKLILKAKKKTSVLIAVLIIIGIAIGLLLKVITSNVLSDGKEENTNKGQNERKVEDDQEAKLEGTTKIAENNNYEMYYNSETTGVSVLVKSTGKIWSTNPSDDYLQSVKNETMKEGFLTQLELKYYNKKDKEVVLSSYTDSVIKKQFTVNKLENGVEILYEIGMKDAIMIAPKVFRVKTFETLLAAMNEEDAKYMNKQYYKASYSNIPEDKKKDCIKYYPSIEKEDLYIIRELSPDVERSVPIRARKKLDELLRRYNFTAEDMFHEYSAIGHEASETAQALFFVPVTYTLNEDGLKAKIETEQIEYDSNEFKLNTISFLRYFGAAQPNDDGYMFVPDGSGAIINFLQKTENNYYKPIYGTDNSYQIKLFQEYSNQTIMPVYGLKNGDDAFLAIIEGGAANASIMAYTSAVGAGVCNLSPVFDYLNKEAYLLDNIKSKELLKFSTKPMESDICVQFNFLTGKDANYSGMARKYRSVLFAGKTTVDTGSGDLPLFLESIGAIYALERNMGFNKWRDRPITTYKQVGEIAAELQDRGIKDIVYKYKNWVNGGIGNQSYSTKINYVSSLGSKKDFKNLINQAEQNKWKFYPNVDPMYVEKNSMFDRFVEYFDASRDLSGQSVYDQDFNIATLKRSWWAYKYILSPHKLTNYMADFMGSYDKLDLDNISIENFGKDLNSDFKKDAVVTRSATADVLTNIVENVKESGMKIAVDTGNSFLLPYVDVVFNVPSTSSAYDIETLSVPFAQIVLHGYVEFCGEPINLSGDPEIAVLRAAEHGTGLHYLVNYEKDTVFKNTYLSKYYSTNYEKWEAHIIDNYDRLNSELRGLSTVPIYEHNQLSEDVFETVYENGARVVVNYSDTEYMDTSGVVVPALDFANIRR